MAELRHHCTRSFGKKAVTIAGMAEVAGNFARFIGYCGDLEAALGVLETRS